MELLSKVSICVPTYNSESTIDTCLKSIEVQNYPKNLIEIIIVDGGSSDNTINICKKYTDIILDNPDRIEEKGKTLAIKKTSGDIIGFIDADNLLEDNFSLQKIVQPFMDNNQIVFSEPKFYSSRKDDDMITKYISLIGGDDPVTVYLGVYDRYCYFKSDWTSSDYDIVTKNNNYDVIKLKDINDMPPLGANTCFIKKNALLNVKYDPFLHTDVIHRLLTNNILFAKINVGVIHKQDGSLINFLKKKIRRLKRNYASLNREYYFNINKKRFITFLMRFLLIFPLIIDSAIGYKNKRSKVWFFHPIFVLLTLLVYIYYFLVRRLWK